MDLESIKSIWESWKEVQEKKALDPVGKADGDIDNDGDEDSSDEYLANRRKKIGKEIAKDDVKEEDDSEEDDSEEDSEDDEKKSKKPKKGVNPFAKKKDDEDDEDEDDVKEAKEYSYTVVHAKKGKVVVKAPTSYDAAQKAAKQWKLKSTAGIDSYIMEDTDVKMPEWLQVIGEKLKAMEESDDPVADEEEAYKDDKKVGGNRKATATNRKAVDKEIQKGYGKQPANEPGEDQPNSKNSPSKEKQIKTAYEEVEDDFDNEGDEEDAARIKKRAMRNSDVDDNGEPTKEKMKGMRKEDFASEADWRVTSMREALAVMDKQRSGLNQTPQAKNQSKMATSTEPMLDVLTSVGEAEFVLKQKQSNPDYEDMEDNKATLPTGVKTQSPSRRGTDNLNNGDGKAPRSPRK